MPPGQSGAGMSTATVHSFRAAAKHISKAANTLSKRLFPKGLRMIGEEIMTDIKDAKPGKGVPVDQGALRSSGMVTSFRGPRVELAFGGASAPYALIQHEVTSYRHPVGEARYLVRGLERWREGTSAAWALLQKKMAASLRRQQRRAAKGGK